MHIELVDLFRCPNPHEDSWLIAASDRSESRVILDGTLGCPVCGAEYEIRDGVSRFTGDPSSGSADPDARIEDDAAMRIAALLDATSAAATIAMLGGSVAVARAVQGIVPARCIVVNATDEDRAADRALPDDAPLAVVRARALPVADGSLSAVWIAHGAVVDVDAVRRTLRAGGRLVAPVSMPLPAGVLELARDTTEWVAERGVDASAAAAPAALTQLRRRR